MLVSHWAADPHTWEERTILPPGGGLQLDHLVPEPRGQLLGKGPASRGVAVWFDEGRGPGIILHPLFSTSASFHFQTHRSLPRSRPSRRRKADYRRARVRVREPSTPAMAKGEGGEQYSNASLLTKQPSSDDIKLAKNVGPLLLLLLLWWLLLLLWSLLLLFIPIDGGCVMKGSVVETPEEGRWGFWGTEAWMNGARRPEERASVGFGNGGIPKSSSNGIHLWSSEVWNEWNWPSNAVAYDIHGSIWSTHVGTCWHAAYLNSKSELNSRFQRDISISIYLYNWISNLYLFFIWF